MEVQGTNQTDNKAGVLWSGFPSYALLDCGCIQDDHANWRKSEKVKYHMILFTHGI